MAENQATYLGTQGRTDPKSLRYFDRATKKAHLKSTFLVFLAMQLSHLCRFLYYKNSFKKGKEKKAISIPVQNVVNIMDMMKRKREIHLCASQQQLQLRQKHNQLKFVFKEKGEGKGKR